MIEGLRPLEIDFRERCRELEQVIGVDAGPVSVLRRAFPKLGGDGAVILAMLMKRDFVTRSGLYAVMYAGRPDCDMPSENVVDVQLHRLRGVLGDIGCEIQAPAGNGWFISKRDKTKIRGLMETTAPADLEACARLADQKARRIAFLDGA